MYLQRTYLDSISTATSCFSISGVKIRVEKVSPNGENWLKMLGTTLVFTPDNL